MLGAFPDFIPGPFQPALNTSAMRFMENLVVLCAFRVGEVADRTCAQDGRIDGEVELDQGLLFGV